MSDGDDIHKFVRIIYLVNHPIIANTDTPAVLSAGKFTTA
jgi:hypothetical protein